MRTILVVLRLSFLLLLFEMISSASDPARSAPPPSLPVGSDQVLFLNGDRLTGALIEVSSGSVRLKTKAIGEISIPWETIAKVTSADRWVVLNPQKKFDSFSYLKYSSATLELQSGKPVLLLDHQPPVLIDESSLAEFGDAPPAPDTLGKCLSPYPETPFTPELTAWALSLNAAPSMINGTQSQEQFGGALTIDVCEVTKSNHSVFDVYGSHVRSWKAAHPSIITDTFESSFAQQHMLRGPGGPLVYGIADFYFNTSLGMALQKSFGAGYHSSDFATGPFTYSWQADVRYFNERLYNTSPSLNLAGARFQGRAAYKKGKFGIATVAWINPMFNDGHALQGLASISPSVAFKPWLCFGLKSEDDYLGNSPAGNRKNYVSSSLNLSIQHGGGSCN